MNIRRDQMPDATELAQRLAPALVEAGQALIAQMHMRVQRGIGLDDSAMPAYADSTAKQKRKRGRDVTTRNLTETGSMLRSMHLESVSVDGTAAEIVIGFSNAEDGRKAAFNQQRAPWFGASPKDQEIIGEVLTERISDILEGVQ